MVRRKCRENAKRRQGFERRENEEKGGVLGILDFEIHLCKSNNSDSRLEWNEISIQIQSFQDQKFRKFLIGKNMEIHQSKVQRLNNDKFMKLFLVCKKFSSRKTFSSNSLTKIVLKLRLYWPPAIFLVTGRRDY